MDSISKGGYLRCCCYAISKRKHEKGQVLKWIFDDI